MKKFSIIFFIILLTNACNLCEPGNSPSDQPSQIGEASYSIAKPDNNLYIVVSKDSQYLIVEEPRTGRMAIRTGNGQIIPSQDYNRIPDTYLEFDIDDDLLFQRNPTQRVILNIEYLDEGTGSFVIHYDSIRGSFARSMKIKKEGSGEIRVASIPLCDAYFGNRNNGTDFRIADNQDDPEIILKVSAILIRPPEVPLVYHVDDYGANPYDDQPDSDAIQESINRACSGDQVIFSSPGVDDGYTGYRIDKTIFLTMAEKSNLTFTSSNIDKHAKLKATADLKGFVVQLYSRFMQINAGRIDNIVFKHIDVDGNMQERVCRGQNGVADGIDDNYGSWLPECQTDNDAWCKAGGLGFHGAIDMRDIEQNYVQNPNNWSTGLKVFDTRIFETECGTALFFSGAAGEIRDSFILLAGDHVHRDSCDQFDPDESIGAWSDGMTISGPAHLIEDNQVRNASDIGIVHFGGRDTIIRNNRISSSEGNFGAFAGIALHPWWFGNNGNFQIIGNRVTNHSSNACGGIHAGINIGAHMWGKGCSPDASNIAALGTPNTCTTNAVAPNQITSCVKGQPCQIWAVVPRNTTFTLKDNIVYGAHINYLIGGIQFLGTFIDENNISDLVRSTDWEGAVACEIEGNTASWPPLSKAAYNPILEGWDILPVYCAR